MPAGACSTAASKPKLAQREYQFPHPASHLGRFSRNTASFLRLGVGCAALRLTFFLRHRFRTPLAPVYNCAHLRSELVPRYWAPNSVEIYVQSSSRAFSLLGFPVLLGEAMLASVATQQLLADVAAIATVHAPRLVTDRLQYIMY